MPRRMLTKTLMCILVLAMLAGNASAHDERIEPADGVIALEEAIKTAAERLIDAHGFTQAQLDEQYEAQGVLLRSTGIPERLWYATFTPNEGTEDVRTYYFYVDAQGNAIAAEGWQAKAGGGGSGAGLSDREALAHAAEAIRAFFGLEDDTVNDYNAEVFRQTMKDGTETYEVYWIPKNINEPGTYYVSISVETGTILQVHYTEMVFG